MELPEARTYIYLYSDSVLIHAVLSWVTIPGSFPTTYHQLHPPNSIVCRVRVLYSASTYAYIFTARPRALQCSHPLSLLPRSIKRGTKLTNIRVPRASAARGTPLRVMRRDTRASLHKKPRRANAFGSFLEKNNINCSLI
jgi:hypothetical protein